MVLRNKNFSNLDSHYLFPEVNRRKEAFLNKNKNISIISLGIGDTSEPIPHSITQALARCAQGLGTIEGYSGYGPEQGSCQLRQMIAKEIYHNKVSADEIFISDGAKCDLGRLQILFGRHVRIAIQDPAYPVYFDGSRIEGVDCIERLPCNPENYFWPNLRDLQASLDLIYWCSPNNPTGAVSTKEQLSELVSFAKENHSIILFDSAYAQYIQDRTLPRSIYEIEGANEVAIEVGSFSKMIGFSGIRLGWTVVPFSLKYHDGNSIRADWSRLTSTIFNGASNISQAGGIAALHPEGQYEIRALIAFYLKNASLLKIALQELDLQVYGGDHAPYLWVKIPGKSSWEAFQEILEKTHIITTPGLGFGPSGEGFLRLSAFGHREIILEAIKRLGGLRSLN